MANIKVEDVIKGIALIERAVGSPLVKGAIVALLPRFGLTSEQQAQVAANHADYVDWEAEARRAAGQT